MSLNLSQRRFIAHILAIVAIGQLTLVQYLSSTAGVGLPLLGSFVIALALIGVGFKLLAKPA